MVDGWTVVGLSGAALAAMAAGIAVAVVVWAGVRRPVNVQLAAIIILDAALTVTLALATFTPDDFAWSGVLGSLAFGALFAGLYGLGPLLLLFLGTVLRTPLVWPWHQQAVRGVLWVWFAAGVVAAIAAAVRQVPVLPIDVEAALYFLSMVSLYALVCCVAAYIEAPRGLRKRQARAFTIAFGAKDLLWFVLFAGSQVWLLWQEDVPGFNDTLTSLAPLYALMPVASILFSTFLTIGFMRTHMLGIDLRLRKTVAHAIVGATFLLAIFLVAGIAEQWLQRFSLLAGGLSAGLLFFLLHPLQRFAERLASLAVPDAQSLDAMRLQQKVDLYREQVEIAWQDGRLALKERRLLDVARARLGIEPGDAARIESEVTRLLWPGRAAGGE